MERNVGVVKGVALVGMMVVTMLASEASAVEMVTLEKATYGPYSGKACVVANSEASWSNAMNALETAGALAVLPAPAPPADVNWATEVVVLVSAGATGYDVELRLTPVSPTTYQVEPLWVPLSGQDGGESLPYQIVKMPKQVWLQDLTVAGSDVDSTLPLAGADGSVPAGRVSWGQMKASYR